MSGQRQSARAVRRRWLLLAVSLFGQLVAYLLWRQRAESST
ncbi:hypothetical protein [Arthrobacter sp. SLBN-83]|nr:hypothetical protein [Arthrobacter sp. SLBN-83]